MRAKPTIDKFFNEAKPKAPIGGTLMTYICIRLSDLDHALTDGFEEFLGEVSQDGVTVTIRELQQIMPTTRSFANDCQKLIAEMQAVKATTAILI